MRGRVERSVSLRFRIASSLVAALLLAGPAAALQGFSQTFDEVDWLFGPTSADVGDVGEIWVPRGYVFCDGANARKLMELCGNPPSNQELGVVCDDASDWFVVFEWNPLGYVRDDDRDKLDAETILGDIRQGNTQANRERQRLGVATIEVIGWHRTPHYDVATNNLEWCVLGSSEGQQILNYNIRMLGRRGVMSATLVCDPSQLDLVLPSVRALLDEFAFKTGQTYGEYRAGDHVAEIGLAGLVVGGGAALAWKAGLLQKLWKLVVVVFVAVGAFLKRLIGWLFSASPKRGELALEAEPPRRQTYVHPLEAQAQALAEERGVKPEVPGLGRGPAAALPARAPRSSALDGAAGERDERGFRRPIQL